MLELTTILLLGLVLVCTFTIEGITGFGSTILALPFAFMMLSANEAVLLLTANSLVTSLIILIMDRKHISWKALLTIVVLAGIGMPVGFAVRTAFPEAVLKCILAAFMVIIGIRGVVNGIKEVKAKKAGVELEAAAAPATPFKKFIMYALIFVGGVVHGAFGSGGPLFVVYTAQALPEPRKMRGTMALVWIILGLILVGQSWFAGDFTLDMGKLMLATIPFMCLGIFIGNLVHKRINVETFRLMVYSVLVAGGIAMAYNTLFA